MVWVCVILGGACQKRDPISSQDASVTISKSKAPDAAGVQAGSYPVRVQDDRGHEIVFLRSPRRIVVAGTALYSEILVDLGAHTKIVGLVKDPNHPPELQHVVRIGTIWPLQVEKVLALQPDLVLGTFEPYRTQLEKVGKVTVYTGGKRGAALQSVADIFTLIRQIDRICHGHTKRADVLIQRMQLAIQALQAKVKRGSRKKVAILYLSQPQSSQIFIANQQTPGHELVEMAGGINVFAKYSGLATNIEVLLRENPDILITDPNHVLWIKQHRVLQGMLAVKRGKVYGIPASRFTSSRVVRVFRKIVAVMQSKD